MTVSLRGDALTHESTVIDHICWKADFNLTTQQAWFQPDKSRNHLNQTCLTETDSSAFFRLEKIYGGISEVLGLSGEPSQVRRSAMITPRPVIHEEPMRNPGEQLKTCGPHSEKVTLKTCSMTQVSWHKWNSRSLNLDWRCDQLC